MAADRPLRVWVTRAEPGAAATAERLRALGHDPLVAPLLVVRPLAVAPPNLSGVAALAFTSARGVEAFAALTLRRDRPVFAVGDATAQAARSAGFAEVVSAGADGEALARLILDRPPDGLVLHAGAREPAFDLAGALLAAGQPAASLPVYETAAVEALPEAARGAGVDAVLVQSPKAARALAALAPGLDPQGIAVFALSENCAAPLRASGFASVAVAPFPREAALLKLLS